MVPHRIGWLLAAFSLAAAAAGRDVHDLPLVFEANGGQSDPSVHFIARSRGYTLLLTQDGAVFRSGGGDVRMRFAGASPNAKLVGLEPLESRISYFIGAGSPGWFLGMPAFGEVKLCGAYPGIDIVYSSLNGRLKYSLVVAPGADPAAVQIEFEGDRGTDLDSSGALLIRTSAGYFRHAPPRTAQSSQNRQVEVGSRYQKAGEHSAALQLDAYDREREVVIDPVVDYSTYLGGSGSDCVTGMAVDSLGNLYLAGWTESTSFPFTGSKLGTTGSVDAFVAKLNPAGTAVTYLTYLGGRGQDYALGLAVDASGSAVVTGWTMSTDFPAVAAAQARLAGSRNAFAAKLSPAGTSLTFSTFWGGNGSDNGNAIALDAAGSIYIAGDTTSTNFPTANAVQKNLAGQQNAFVTKLSSSGTLVYSTYFGGSATDSAASIAVDGSGNAYIAGGTWSLNLPVASALQAANGGGQDAFVAKLNASGSALIYSTYLGGSGGSKSYAEAAAGLQVDTSGNAYVVGVTSSPNFPVANAFRGSLNGASDGFAVKLNGSGSALIYGTYLGGSSSVDNVTAIVIDTAGDAYAAGYTASSDFPVSGAIQPTLAGEYDAYVTKLSPAGNLLMSTYLGGTGMDAAYAVALDSFGDLYVAGETQSVDFLNVSALEKNKLGGISGFVVKMPSGSAVNPVLSAPAAGTVLTSSPVTFAWNSVAGAIDYRIDIGTSAGKNDTYSGFTGGSTLIVVPLSQFLNGETIYVELYAEFPGAPIVTGTGNQFSFATAAPDFSISATPSQTVMAGSGTSYVVTVAAVYGFNAAVTFSVSGLPAGANATFAPPSVTGGGSTTMTVSTLGSTSGGTYPLTITAASGSLLHTAGPGLTVTVPPDFSVSVPASQTIPAGAAASYSVSVAALNGFNGAVTFSISGLPGGASAAFAPASVAGSGSTTLTIDTTATALAGTYPLTVTAVSGGLSHSGGTSLVVMVANITISSAGASLMAGQTQQLTATVTGLWNTAVNWSISPQVGSISSSGLYTAPASITSQQNVTVTATSRANPNLSGSAVVMLLAGLQSDLYLTNMSFSSGATTYQARNSITAGVNFTVGGAATVSFVAGNSVTLGPGFTATAGTAGVTFSATINPDIQQ